MSDHDLLLGDTVTTLVSEGADTLIELVADGIMWSGRPVAGSAWAGALPRRQGERTPLRDRLAVSGYVHLHGARYRLADRWAPAGNVRLRLDSVSAWWLHGAEPLPGGEEPVRTGTNAEAER